MSSSADERIAAIAVAQHGVFTRAQAISAGFARSQIDRQVRGAAWIRLLPRVYRAAAGPCSALSPLWAAVLWAGPGCVLSHFSAAALWRLDPARRGPPELVVPKRRGPSARGVIVHRVAAIDERDVHEIVGLPVTAPARTIIDLACVVADDELAVALESKARRQGLLTLSSLLARLDGLGSAGRAGAARVRRVAESLAGDGPSAVRLEVEVAALLAERGLHAPVRRPGAFVWPDPQVVLECDARSVVERRHAPDRARRAALAAEGWCVLVVTWDDVRRPEEVAAHVARALGVFARARAR